MHRAGPFDILGSYILARLKPGAGLVVVELEAGMLWRQG